MQDPKIISLVLMIIVSW